MGNSICGDEKDLRKSHIENDAIDFQAGHLGSGIREPTFDYSHDGRNIETEKGLQPIQEDPQEGIYRSHDLVPEMHSLDEHTIVDHYP
jgi:hypothetical protein